MHSILKVRHKLFGLTAALAVLGGCSAPAPSTQALPPAKAAAHTAEAQSAKVNLDQIFPPGRGRELVLTNCTSCHTFVPIVILQMTKDAWERNSRDHRGRVASLSDADFKTLYEYLTANFNPGRPVPNLPQELLNTWTAY